MPRIRTLTKEGRLKEIDKTICERCMNELFKAGIKKKQIAETVGISQACLSMQIERRKLSTQVIVAIVDATGANANNILSIE